MDQDITQGGGSGKNPKLQRVCVFMSVICVCERG